MRFHKIISCRIYGFLFILVFQQFRDIGNNEPFQQKNKNHFKLK
jgi:hypothetical protein